MREPLHVIAATIGFTLLFGSLASLAEPGETAPDAARAASAAASDPCECDVTGDGVVAAADNVVMSADLGCTAGVGLCPGDCTGDGVTGVRDRIGLFDDWQRTDCP